MPITVKKQLRVTVEDAEFVFKHVVLADIMDFGEQPTQKEMLGVLSQKLVSWKGIQDEEGNEIECSADNFLKILPTSLAGKVIKEFLEVSGMGETFGKKSEPHSQLSESSEEK